LNVPDDTPGSKVRCPTCKEMNRVPGERPQQETHDVSQVLKCPGCKRSWSAETVICTDCGYNFQTRRKMKTKVDVPERVIVLGMTFLGTFTRWRVFRGPGNRPYLSIVKKFLFLPISNKDYLLTEFRAILTDYRGGDEETDGVLHADLVGNKGKDAVKIYRSTNDAAFKALIEAVSAVGSLPIQRR
jgi:hypothetical protein